jgi:hypothetical protein
MNTRKLFAFIALSALVASCSSDDNNGSSTNVDATDSFTYIKDGVTQTITTITAVRHEDAFELSGDTADGQNMYLDFDKYGNLQTAGSIGADFDWKNSFANFSSNYFDFAIVGIDETNKIVKVTYSGKVYEDDYDITSDFSTVSGVINVHYTVVTPVEPGLGTFAKINGTDWHGVKISESNSGDTLDNVVTQVDSGDAYSLNIYVNQEGTIPGTYAFTGATTTNKITLSKFNTATLEEDEYQGVGTLVFTEKTTDEFGITLIAGTFSFTAHDPVTGSDIHITNGTFKEVYTW